MPKSKCLNVETHLRRIQFTELGTPVLRVISEYVQTSVPESAATFSHPKTLQPVSPNDQEYKNLV